MKLGVYAYYIKKSYKADPSKKLQAHKKSYEADPSKKLQAQKKSYEADPSKKLQAQKKSHEADPSKKLQAQKNLTRPTQARSGKLKEIVTMLILVKNKR